MKRRHHSYQPYSSRRLEKKSRTRLIVTILVALILGYLFLTWFFPVLIGSLSFLNRFKPASVSQPSVSDKATLAPPVLNIPYEATNTANIRIKGYAAANAKVEIYVDDELKDSPIAQDDGSFITNDIPLSLGTNAINGKTVDDQGQKSLPSKTIKITYSNEKPKLELKEPSDNKNVQGGDKKVVVAGTTDTDKEISITINGSQVIVDGNGNFSKTVDLNDGDNNITVTATNSTGNSTTISRKVTYQP